MILLVKIGYDYFIVQEKHRDTAIAVLGALTPVSEGGGYNCRVYEDKKEDSSIEIKFIPEACYKSTSGNPELLDKILALEKEREKEESLKWKAQNEANEFKKKLESLPAPEPVKEIEPSITREESVEFL